MGAPGPTRDTDAPPGPYGPNIAQSARFPRDTSAADLYDLPPPPKRGLERGAKLGQNIERRKRERKRKTTTRTYNRTNDPRTNNNKAPKTTDTQTILINIYIYIYILKGY